MDLQKKPQHYIKSGRNYRGMKGWLASHGWQPPEKCEYHSGLPRIEHQNQERNTNNIQLCKATRCLFTRCLVAQWLEKLRATKRVKCIKFHLQSHTLGSGRGRAEWTKATWGDSGFGGSGERGEVSATRVLVLSHSPYYRSHLSWEEHTPPCSISLWESNSSTSEIPLTHLWKKSRATEE